MFFDVIWWLANPDAINTICKTRLCYCTDHKTLRVSLTGAKCNNIDTPDKNEILGLNIRPGKCTCLRQHVYKSCASHRFPYFPRVNMALKKARRLQTIFSDKGDGVKTFKIWKGLNLLKLACSMLVLYVSSATRIPIVFIVTRFCVHCLPPHCYAAAENMVKRYCNFETCVYIHIATLYCNTIFRHVCI